ncbi:hypothetical protein HU200_033405 [Digitaria exilis]|uniref:Uncharacterized protein n=1 Tax=Digitaria exilis TaxID=1010633 RepID=A0A835ENB1_9POAL|nr:hypothetical protein HU200_033405 [Digitaria exilis]
MPLLSLRRDICLVCISISSASPCSLRRPDPLRSLSLSPGLPIWCCSAWPVVVDGDQGPQCAAPSAQPARDTSSTGVDLVSPVTQVLGSMALIPMKPLDGPGGYLRWKESMLLRAHTLGIARVLFEDPPAGDGGDDAAAQAAAKKWARDDALCRGHILATLSDRLLPDYARFTTAGDLWRALARTYDLETETYSTWQPRDMFDAFTFDRGTGALLLEQLAHAEALGVAAGLPDDYVATKLSVKLPELMCLAITVPSGLDKEMPKGMSLVWRIARRVVASGITPERLWKTEEDSDDYSDSPNLEQQQSMAYWGHGEAGYVVRNWKRRA